MSDTAFHAFEAEGRKVDRLWAFTGLKAQSPPALTEDHPSCFGTTARS